jgi:hypothetical protein
MVLDCPPSPRLPHIIILLTISFVFHDLAPLSRYRIAKRKLEALPLSRGRLFIFSFLATSYR